MKKVSIWMTEEMHRKLKVHCVENDFSIQRFVLAAVTVALAVKDGPTDGKTVAELTKSEKNTILTKAERIFKSGDPLAVDMLRATIAFYSSRLAGA